MLVRLRERRLQGVNLKVIKIVLVGKVRMTLIKKTLFLNLIIWRAGESRRENVLNAK
jgi:hypothetical protein